MKKNISINISGIIFHIEEDGYEILRKYLDSINRYFSSFEDNSEILADIESRIAEILLSKLSEGKQVVTAEDVNSLMATMGSVNDFKAAEDDSTAGASAASSSRNERRESKASGEPISNKKLFRDNRRKILGGVCSGLANYFSIDPVWPRLLFALLAFATYGGLVLGYIALWIIVPPSDTLEDESSLKKMYRDTDKRIIGGVASGVAAFLGLDSTVVRVIFIGLSIFGGIGIVIYIIMWIALPEAKTITEKIEMSGERVTLSNIESSVKRGFGDKDNANESIFAKIILFPFRLLATLIDALGKVLGPVFILIVDIFRIAFGVCFTLTGASLIFALVVTLGMLLGFFHIPAQGIMNSWYITTPDFPVDALRHSFPVWTVVTAFVAAFIPALMLSLLGASIIARRIVFNSYVGWSMFVIFFLAVGALTFTVPQMIYAFKEDGEFKVEKTFAIAGTPVLRLNETGLDDYHVTDLTIRRYEGNDIKLVERFEAQGVNRKVASENAQMVEYNVAQNDSVLVFDSNISFKKDATFRAQRLDMELYVPVNRPFIIEGEMWRLIDNRGGRYYRDSREETRTWKVNEYGVLECVSCMKDFEGKSDRSVQVNDQFGLRDFTGVDMQGIFDATIEQGDDFAVELKGNEKDKRHYRVYVAGETLIIEYDENGDSFWKRNRISNQEVDIRITMPRLADLTARGAGKLRFRGFDSSDMYVKLTGAISANGGVDAETMNVDLTGACSLDLAGTGRYLRADVTGASSISAYGFQVRQAEIEARGASTAKVYVTDRIEYTKGIASSVSYRGDPAVVEEN